jgi:uncharacterized membrane protein
MMSNALSSLPHAFTTLAFVLHIGSGTIGLVAGTIAIFAAKGGRLHRAAGTVFFVAMLVMAAFAAYLGLVMPGQLVNVFIAAFATYLVVTAWLAVHRPEGRIGASEKTALLVGIVLCAPFVILGFQTATGMTPFLKSTVPLKGPVLVALYGFTTVLVIAVLGDAKTVLAGGISGAPRIARHLWRMCLGLTMAAGSAFTNGLPRLLPGPMHVTAIYFLPQFVPLILMVFWLIRVRFTGWYQAPAVTVTAT